MTARTSFYRKIAYIFGIAVLWVLLYILGRPATQGSTPGTGSPGGILAQAREKYDLAQTQLGEIDPTSETIKLATLGMRGVAALVLWEKANDYKVKEDWAKYEATLKQIAIVQPHFISVWIHLAWNLSYNISVEFDDYHDRYHWVIEGIKYLQKGIQNNDRNPSLLWETGWVVSQKIGRSDEHKLFRKLFKADDDFHGSRPSKERDNWLVGKEWFEICVDVFLKTGRRVKGKPPLIFMSSPAMCLMNFAEAIEEEGTFDEVAKLAWRKAEKAWFDYGARIIPESATERLILNDMEKHQKANKEWETKLKDLEPGLKDKIKKERYEALTKEQREAYELAPEKRSDVQVGLAMQAEAQLEISYDDLAKKMPPEKRAKAKKYAQEAQKSYMESIDIARAREVVNFSYWKLRAEVEQTDNAALARKAIFEGTQKFREGDLTSARELFHEGLNKWRLVLDDNDALIDIQITGDDLMDVIKIYRKILNQLDEPFPENFILKDIVEKYDRK